MLLAITKSFGMKKIFLGRVTILKSNEVYDEDCDEGKKKFNKNYSTQNSSCVFRRRLVTEKL
jgi:hypothetical protein